MLLPASFYRVIMYHNNYTIAWCLIYHFIKPSTNFVRTSICFCWVSFVDPRFRKLHFRLLASLIFDSRLTTPRFFYLSADNKPSRFAKH